MKKYWLLFVLPLLLSVSSGLFADVILTDEEAKELEQTLDELEMISAEQKKTINNLRMQNSELENQLNELERQAEERQNLLNEQGETLTEAKSLYKKQSIFSILRNILISVCSCGVGILIGMFLL